MIILALGKKYLVKELTQKFEIILNFNRTDVTNQK